VVGVGDEARRSPCGYGWKSSNGSLLSFFLGGGIKC